MGRNGKVGPEQGSVSSMQEDALSTTSDASSEVALKKGVGLIGGISFIVGSIIGSGIFVSPKGVLDGSGSVGLSLIVWAVGGLVVMLGAISYVELGTMITKSGGEYAYLKTAYHRILAFLYSFMQTFMLRPAIAAIISLTCGEYVAVLFFQDDCGSPPALIVKLIGSAVLLCIAAVNIWSVETATKIQIWFTGAKLLALGIIVISGFVLLGQGNTEYLANGFDWYGDPASVGSVAIGFYSSMWAYDGWNQLNLCVEELKEPHKNLPRAILIALPLVTTLYVLTNISYFTVLSPEALLAAPAVALSWAEEVFPDFAWIMPIFVALSTFGAANGMLFTSGRLLFVTAREGDMISLLSFINVKHNTPAPAIAFTTLLAIFMMIPSSIGALIDLFGFASWIFYGLVFSSVIYLRFKAPHYERPFKVPIVLPIIALCVAVYLVLAPLISDPKLEYFYVILFLVVGVIFYFPFVHFKYSIPKIDYMNMFFQLLMQVSPPPEYVDTLEAKNGEEEEDKMKIEEEKMSDVEEAKEEDKEEDEDDKEDTPEKKDDAKKDE